MHTSAFAMVVGIAAGLSAVTGARTTAQQPGSQSAPGRYIGNWVCQSVRPGYNLLLPSSDPSQPLTNKATTPATAIIQKFSLNPDGTYETAKGVGRYRFDPATDRIVWLDGPHKGTLSKTEAGKRPDGASKISFTLNERYYGCYQPKPRS